MAVYSSDTIIMFYRCRHMGCVVRKGIIGVLCLSLLLFIFMFISYHIHRDYTHRDYTHSDHTHRDHTHRDNIIKYHTPLVAYSTYSPYNGAVREGGDVMRDAGAVREGDDVMGDAGGVREGDDVKGDTARGGVREDGGPAPTCYSSQEDGLLTQIRALAKKYGVCGAGQMRLSQVIAAIGIRDTTLGKSLHKWYTLKVHAVEKLRSYTEHLERIKWQNKELRRKIETAQLHFTQCSSLPSRMSKTEFDYRVKAALDKSSYIRSTPDVEVRPKTSFDRLYYYVLPQGIGGSPYLKQENEGFPSTYPAGHYRTAVDEVMNLINSTSQDGLYRTHRLAGTMYEAFTKEELSLDESGQDSRTLLLHHYYLKPFSDLHFVSHHLLALSRKPVHIILPLTHIEGFRMFINHYIKYALPQQHPWLLTVVYGGPANKGAEVKEVLYSKCTQIDCRAYHFVSIATTDLSKIVAKAMSDNWIIGDVVTMVTDIYYNFNAKFVQKCQLYTRRGTQGYFPIAFGLYNSRLAPLPVTGSYVHVRYGRWVDMEVGTFCLYHSDLLQLMGALEHWNDMYQLFTAAMLSHLHIIRGPDRLLVKRWYNMYCDPKWKKERLDRCFAVKTHTLAPVKKLGEILN